MNVHIKQRLQGMYSVLCSAFDAGASMSSASKGYEREVFISILEQCTASALQIWNW